MRIAVLIVVALFLSKSYSHDLNHPHFDHYLSHAEAMNIGFKLDSSDIDWTDSKGNLGSNIITYNAIELYVEFPPKLMDMTIEGSGTILNCGSLLERSGLVDHTGDLEDEFSQLVVTVECAPLAYVVAVYRSDNKDLHFYYIKAESDD